MCFNLGYNIKKGAKIIRVKGRSNKEEEAEDSKGLLYKEIQIWNKNQEKLFNQGSDQSSQSKSNT